VIPIPANPPQAMDIDWQNGLTELKDRGQYLLHSEKWADCRFLVGSSYPPGSLAYVFIGLSSSASNVQLLQLFLFT